MKAMSVPTYTPGSYEMVWSVTYNPNEGNSTTIRKLGVSDGGSGTGGRAAVGLVYFFDHNQEKGNTFSLTINWSYTWDREFS
jgi:hypothetical protein